MQQCNRVIALVHLSFVIGALQVTGLVNLNQTRHRRQSKEEGCVLPSYPEHGQWKLLGGEAKPGDKILKNSVIKFECNSGYKLSNNQPFAVCFDNRFLKQPECNKLCPPLYRSTTYQLRCRDKTGLEIQCNEATEGSYVEYTCAISYETPFGYKRTLLCRDGKWSQKPMCHPVCGKKIIDNAKPLIAGSKPNNVLEYPWVVALYIKENNSYEYICGGSILSLTVALTAAHCVTNDYGDTLNKEDFLIGAGKLYSKHNASQDTRAQYLMLSKIIVHEDFKGASRLFLADIAVLVTKGEFVLNSLVQPVCFNNMNTIYLHPGSIGKVSGWGRTEDEDTSEILRTLNIPYKDGATCAEELPKEFTTTFNIVDKICAGFSNKSTSVCDGDSGNGLTFVNLEDNRYYIHGVVSLGPQRNGQCDIQHNTLYTKVAFYYEYIDRLLTTYAPTIKDCVLPAHPQNGKWTTQQQGLKPGDAVSLSTVLNIECNKGFKLTSLSTNINCGSTHNMPVCQPLCPALNFRNGSNYWCTNKEGQAIDCLEAVEGSTLEYSCPKAYKIADGTGRTNNRTCSMGSWGLPQPECLQSIRNCGRKGNVSNTLNADDTTEGLLEFPWNVNIYKITNKSGLTKYMYNCGGSLVSHKVIVAGASCLSSYKGQVNSEQGYLIGAGKIYPNYNDSRDVHAQYSDVSNIILHKNYKGDTRRYFANIAIIVIKKPFTLNNFVQPICFTDVDNIRLHPGDIGVTLKYKAEDKQELLKIPYREDAICRQELPSEFAEKYYEEDKFCAGTKNQTNLCQGDTGKGFVVKNLEDHRYYIYGIASASYSEEPKKCHHIVLFTNVSIYYDFIDDILSQYE